MSDSLDSLKISTESFGPVNSLKYYDPVLAEKFFWAKPAFNYGVEPGIKPKNPPIKGCICAIIPCLNEELVIGSLILRLKTEVQVDNVIVVDDGSTDRTAEVAKLAGADVISYKENHGKAYALKKGIEYAVKKGCFATIMLDGDGQHHTSDISKVLAPVLSGKADLVIGSRFLEQKNKVPVYRRLGQKTLDIATNFTCNPDIKSDFKITDSQSGFRALGPKALSNMDFLSDGYNIESDMITHMLKKGLKICEVPISVRYDVPNKHKKNPVTHGFGVFGNIVGKIGYSRPLPVFGIPGFSFFMIGIFSGIYVISDYYNYEIFHYLILFISFNMMVVGMLLVMSGLILNSLVQIMKS